MLWIVAWRNIWRNKLRSFVVITAVTLGLIGGLFSMAMMYGMVNQRVGSIIDNELSHVQVHHPEFLENYEIKDVVNDAEGVERDIMKLPEVKAVSTRLRIAGMASTAASGTGVMVVGVDPEAEEKVTAIHERIRQGNYLQGKRDPIVIGEKLAEKLKVHLRSKIVLTFQNREGFLTAGAFRIVGLYRTNNTVFDQGQVFVRKSDLARLTGFSVNEVHEIAILLKNQEDSQRVQTLLAKSWPTCLVETWREIQPDLAMITDLMEEYFVFFMGIILLALGFGVVNTMLMVVLERMRELGMLMAVGMNRSRVFWMIIWESVFLCLIGGIIGMAISYGLIGYFGRIGIDLSAFAKGFEAIGYSSLVYPVLEWKYYFLMGFMVVGMGIVGAVYPALKAIRYQPAHALRME